MCQSVLVFTIIYSLIYDSAISITVPLAAVISSDNIDRLKVQPMVPVTASTSAENTTKTTVESTLQLGIPAQLIITTAVVEASNPTEMTEIMLEPYHFGSTLTLDPATSSKPITLSKSAQLTTPNERKDGITFRFESTTMTATSSSDSNINKTFTRRPVLDRAARNNIVSANAFATSEKSPLTNDGISSIIRWSPPPQTVTIHNSNITNAESIIPTQGTTLENSETFESADTLKREYNEALAITNTEELLQMEEAAKIAITDTPFYTSTIYPQPNTSTFLLISRHISSEQPISFHGENINTTEKVTKPDIKTNLNSESITEGHKITIPTDIDNILALGTTETALLSDRIQNISVVTRTLPPKEVDQPPISSTMTVAFVTMLTKDSELFNDETATDASYNVTENNFTEQPSASVSTWSAQNIQNTDAFISTPNISLIQKEVMSEMKRTNEINSTIEMDNGSDILPDPSLKPTFAKIDTFHDNKSTEREQNTTEHAESMKSSVIPLVGTEMSFTKLAPNLAPTPTVQINNIHIKELATRRTIDPVSTLTTATTTETPTDKNSTVPVVVASTNLYESFEHSRPSATSSLSDQNLSEKSNIAISDSSTYTTKVDATTISLDLGHKSTLFTAKIPIKSDNNIRQPSTETPRDIKTIPMQTIAEFISRENTSSTTKYTFATTKTGSNIEITTTQGTTVAEMTSASKVLHKPDAKNMTAFSRPYNHVQLAVEINETSVERNITQKTSPAHSSQKENTERNTVTDEPTSQITVSENTNFNLSVTPANVKAVVSIAPLLLPPQPFGFWTNPQLTNNKTPLNSGITSQANQTITGIPAKSKSVFNAPKTLNIDDVSGNMLNRNKKVNFKFKGQPPQIFKSDLPLPKSQQLNLKFHLQEQPSQFLSHSLQQQPNLLLQYKQRTDSNEPMYYQKNPAQSLSQRENFVHSEPVLPTRLSIVTPVASNRLHAHVKMVKHVYFYAAVPSLKTHPNSIVKSPVRAVTHRVVAIHPQSLRARAQKSRGEKVGSAMSHELTNPYQSLALSLQGHNYK